VANGSRGIGSVHEEGGEGPAATLRIIALGWRSSGHYSADVLESTTVLLDTFGGDTDNLWLMTSDLSRISR
jgi:hypothetical protein